MLNVKVIKVFGIIFAIIKDLLQGHILNSTEDNTVVKVIQNTDVIIAKISGCLRSIQRFVGMIGIVEELARINPEELGKSFEDKNQIELLKVLSDDIYI